MSFTKNIHFRGSDAVVTIAKSGEAMAVLITDKVPDGKILFSSNTTFPHVLIERTAQSDFWDLVREEILSVGTRKEENFMKCTLLQAIQKRLQH